LTTSSAAAQRAPRRRQADQRLDGTRQIDRRRRVPRRGPWHVRTPRLAEFDVIDDDANA